MAGALAWPTTGAEVRPWFLFPQRWPPPPPGPLPVPGIPGWGPLSLHARLENISLFLSSHFIIFPPLFSPRTTFSSLIFPPLSREIFHRKRTEREKERERESRERTHPQETSFRFTSRKVLLNVSLLLRRMISRWISAPRHWHSLEYTWADHGFSSSSLFPLFPFSTPIKPKLRNLTFVKSFNLLVSWLNCSLYRLYVNICSTLRQEFPSVLGIIFLRSTSPRFSFQSHFATLNLLDFPFRRHFHISSYFSSTIFFNFFLTFPLFFATWEILFFCQKVRLERESFFEFSTNFLSRTGDSRLRS